MKRFLGLLKKEFLHIFRDTRTILILFGMPIAQILIFGYVIKNEVKDVDIAIVDYANDDSSKELTEKILASGYFNLYGMFTTGEEISEKFRQGKIREAIIIENGFGKNLEKEGSASVELICDATDPNYANLISKYTAAICQEYAMENSPGLENLTKIKLDSRMLYNEEMKSSFLFVPGTMAFILMLLSALMSSISIAREKEFGSMEVLLVSPLKPIQVILGKVMPYVLLAFLNAVSVIFVGYFVFGVPVQGSMLLLMFASVLFVITALSLGIMISTFTKTQESAMMISMFALMLPTMLLSGFIFPVENMPLLLQGLSTIIPARWYLEIIKGIMLKSSDISFIWQQSLILIGMSVVFILISVKNYKLRLE